MVRPGIEAQPALRRLDIPQRLQEAGGRIGLTEMSRAEIDARFVDIAARTRIGLSRKGKPQILTEGPHTGMASDGGFPALRSEVRLPSSENWARVPVKRGVCCKCWGNQ